MNFQTLNFFVTSPFNARLGSLSGCERSRYVSPFLQATKALRVSRGTALLFSRIFGTRWGWGTAPRPGRFYPGKDPILILQEAWFRLYGRAENLVPTEIRSLTVQPVARRYTD